MASQGVQTILRDLRRHRTMGDLTRDNIGSDLLEIAANSHRRCIDEERSPDSTPWEELSSGYEMWKSRKYPGKKMAHLHEIMTADAEMEGDRIIEPNQASYTFGVSDEARAEASHFEEGGDNRPDRPFTGLDAQAVEESDNRNDANHLKILAG